MKKTILTVAIGAAVASSALADTVLHTASFADANFIPRDNTGSNSNFIGDPATGAGTAISSGNFFGSTTGGIASSLLTLSYEDHRDRSKAVGFYLDLNGYGIGDYKIVFNISDFELVNGEANELGEAFYSADFFSGALDSGTLGSVTFDGHSNSSFNGWKEYSVDGGASKGTSVGPTSLTAGGEYTVAFSLTSAAVAGDGFVVSWNVGANGVGGDGTELDSGGTIEIDSLVVYSVIPEPGTAALLSGICALSFVMIRRRQS